SAPTTASTPLPRNGLAMSSTASASPAGSASSGVMSLNITPFLGKSGTSRMRGSSRSMRRSVARRAARAGRDGRARDGRGARGVGGYTVGVPKSQSDKSALEIVEPIGKRVLVRKDEDKKQTRAGIHLPDKIEIPTLTGRIVAVSRQVAGDEDYPIQRYDRVL